MAFPSSWRSSRFAAPGVLLLASLALYGGGLLPDRAFFVRDVLRYYWPMQATHWRLGAVPQWNPFHQGGLPFLADIHSGVLYPPNLLFAVLSFPTAYALLLVLHHAVGQWGMFTFLRAKGFEPPAAFTGALAFGLSGYVASLCDLGPLVSGLAWVPWVLATLQAPLARPRKLALLALLILLLLLSGDPQSGLYAAIAAAVYVLWYPGRGRQLVTLAGAGVLGLLLAGAQVVPTLWLLAESTRNADTPAHVTSWSLPWPRLLEFAIPYPFGEYLGQPPFWAWSMIHGPSPTPFAFSVYLGITVWVLAVLGARRERFTGFALTLCGGGVLLALGQDSPLSFLFAHAPLSLFRYPEKYVVLVALGGAGLAASGAKAVLADVPWRRLLGLGVAALLLGAVLGVLWAEPPALLAGVRAGLRTRPPQEVLLLAARSVRTALVFMVALLGLVALARRVPAVRGALPVLLPLLVAGDLLWTARSTVILGPRSLYTQEPQLLSRLREEVGTPPTRLLRMDAMLAEQAPGSRTLEEVIQLTQYGVESLVSNLPGVHGLEELTTYGGVELWRWRAFTSALAVNPPLMARLYGTCLWTTSASPRFHFGEELTRVASGPESIDVRRLSDCPARLRTASRTTPVAEPNEALALLRTERLDGLHHVAVEQGAARTYGAARVEDLQLDARSARARVVAGPGGTFVVFATTFYPGWSATVDGEEMPVYAVNGAHMGLEVPEGDHRIELAFTDPGLVSGIQASLVGLLVLGLVLLRGREDKAPPPTPTP
ncbi:YfhO family protein [Melittangium boletus]|uniref:YfhO family protein n=1 Tax=Melittangium boletus TaxID=83453 RepID=UPI003DA2158F